MLLRLGIILCLFSFSCQYKKYESIYPGKVTPGCDTSVVTYTKDIQPFINQNCIRCHSTTASDASGGGIALDSYSNMKDYSFSAYDAIKGPAYYMPLGGPKVDTCNILKLKRWIASGRLN